MSDYGVLDIENAGEPWSGQLLCIGWRDKAYTPFTPGWHGMLAELADPSIAKVVFTKHDHRWLILAGFDVAGPIIDVQTMAWVVNERVDLDLASLTAKYVPHEVKASRIKQRAGHPYFICDNGESVPLEQAPIAELLAYNEQDLASTDALYRELLRLIRYEGLSRYWQSDVLPFTPVLVGMETRGVPIDVAGAEELRERLEGEIAYYERKLHTEAALPDDFNLNSNQQLAQFLYSRTFTIPARASISKEERDAFKAALASGQPVTHQGIDVERVGTAFVHGTRRLQGLGLRAHRRTDAGAPATDAKTLRVHYGDVPWVADLLEASSRRTVVNTFLKAIAEQSHNGRLYGRFNQTGTKTGRLSSSGPNLQNMPAHGPMGRAVRELFRPEPGRLFVHGDYGQLEPRLMAHFSGDPVLRSIYEQGQDIYLETARRVFGCTLEEARAYRNPMKTYVLALGYGSGAKTLHKGLAEKGFRFSLSEVEDTLANLKRVYSVLFDWKESVISDAQNEGYVETLSGHRRRFGGTSRRETSWRAQGTDERQAVNAVIQGSAADIVGRSMMRVTQALPELSLLVQVHDELLFEARAPLRHAEAVLSTVQTICEEGHGFDLAVPLEFVPRIVNNWAEGKD